MSNKQPFQYAILKYIHDPATEEFLNIGLVIYSKKYKYFRAELLTRYGRITQTFPGADGILYSRYIKHIQVRLNKISQKITREQQQSSFPDISDNINDLLIKVIPPNDSSIQFSSPKGGLTADLDLTFNDLYSRLVEYYLSDIEKISRSNEDVWKTYSSLLSERNVLANLQPKVIITQNDEIEFQHAWKNGRWNLLQPLSFDLVIPTYIRKKARTWLGTLTLMKYNKEWSNLYFLLGKPISDQKNLQNAYNDAKDILITDIDSLPIKLIEEDEAEDFTKEITPQIEEDTGI